MDDQQTTVTAQTEAGIPARLKRVENAISQLAAEVAPLLSMLENAPETKLAIDVLRKYFPHEFPNPAAQAE